MKQCKEAEENKSVPLEDENSVSNCNPSESSMKDTTNDSITQRNNTSSNNEKNQNINYQPLEKINPKTVKQSNKISLILIYNCFSYLIQKVFKCIMDLFGINFIKKGKHFV